MIAALALAHERLDVTRAMVVAHTDCCRDSAPDEREEKSARRRGGRGSALRAYLRQIEAGGFVYDVETGRC